jgi:hypothetical protein
MQALEFLTLNDLDCRISCNGLIIYTQDEEQASSLADLFFEDFALTAHKLGNRVQLRWGTDPNLIIEIHNWMYQEMSQNNIFLPQPGLFLGEIKIYTPEFFRTLNNLLDRKGERLGLVRVSDNMQIAVTAGMSQHLDSLDLQPNTRIKREEYWHLEDLHSFMHNWKRDLFEGGSIEYTYRALTNAVINKQDWSRFTTRYTLLVDGNEYYHLAEILDIEPIAPPIRA